MKFETQQIHAGFSKEKETGARVTPVYQTASYYFDSSEHARRLFNLEESGNIYTRIGNPTNAVLEDRIATLEGGVGGLVVSSGHAAQLIALTTIAEQGDNIVTSPFLYGGTHNQFDVTLRKFGIDARFSQDLNPESFEKYIDDKTKAIYLESIGNPTFVIPDFKAFSTLSQKYGIPLIVDNTFGAGGYLCQPISHGAHIVTHSATKWIGGHGNSMGGIIVDAGTFDWNSPKFPSLSEPSRGYHGKVFCEEFGNKAFISRARAEMLRDLGPVQSPFNSFLLLQGLETLSLRVGRQTENALALAKWLDSHPLVESVNYPGLETHSSHLKANVYLQNGYGCVLGFEIAGSVEETARFVDSLKLVGHMANVGDNRTLVIQPANTTHQQLSQKDRESAGVTSGLVRVSVGIEHIDDIIADFTQALDKVNEQ